MPPTVRPVWHKEIAPYIPLKVHRITLEGRAGGPGLVFVPTAAGAAESCANRSSGQPAAPGERDEGNRSTQSRRDGADRTGPTTCRSD